MVCLMYSFIKWGSLNLLQSVEVAVFVLALKSISFKNINMGNGNELVGLEYVDFDEDIILSENIFVSDDTQQRA